MTEIASIRREVDVALEAWRESATHAALVVLAVLGLPATAYFFVEESFPYPWPARWTGMLAYGAIVAAVCLRRLNYRWRLVVLLTALYAVATQQLLLTGLVGEGRLILLVIPLLATILRGARAGWVSALASSLMLAVFTLLAAQGRLQRWQVIQENSVEFWQWLAQGLLLLGSLSALMILLTKFLNLQLRTMLAEREACRARDQFPRQLITAQENERHRFAGELHDGVGQDLLVIANQAQLGLTKAGDLSGTAAQLSEIAEAARQALRQARRLVHNLRPGLLEELGLTEAVEVSVAKAGQASGMGVKLNLANVDGLLPPEFEVNLFRILQEALNNILKHAAATETQVTLAHDNSALRLVVEDNGRGFDPAMQHRLAPGRRGLGLQQMAERAAMMGGRVDLQSRPGRGTRLVVEVPVKET